MDDVVVQPNVPYGRGARRRMSIYRPAQAPAAKLPAVVFVTGYPDPGAERMLGCKLMDMASYVCWARLVACMGLVGILYENEEPGGDARSLLEHIKTHADSLRVDATRLGVWSTLDRFALHAREANLPITLINYPEGPHAFDIVDPSEGPRAIVREILGFLKAHLLA